MYENRRAWIGHLDDRTRHGIVTLFSQPARYHQDALRAPQGRADVVHLHQGQVTGATRNLGVGESTGAHQHDLPGTRWQHSPLARDTQQEPIDQLLRRRTQVELFAKGGDPHSTRHA